MVSTKSAVKIIIRDWISRNDYPFSTKQLKNNIVNDVKNVRISPQRLAKFIKGTGAVTFDNKTKKWYNIKKLER
jgi:hypothetical protein